MQEKLKLINIKWELKKEDVEDFDSKEDAISFLNKLPSEEIIDSELCYEIIDDDFGMDYDTPNLYTDLEKILVEKIEDEYSPFKIISYELIGLKECVERYKQSWIINEDDFLKYFYSDNDEITLENAKNESK